MSMRDYTLLEYIESSGTQYIDTGFKPNNNTGVAIDFEPTSASALGTAYSFFGTRAAKEDGEYFAFFKASSANFNLYWEFAELYDHIWNVANKTDFTARRTVVVNGASATVGGVTKTYPARTFQTKLNMYLFADNEKGAVGYPAYMKLYSCQIYDNGTLIRDYVPAKRKPDGAVGMLDKLNNVFYGNKGTGAFIAGPEVPVQEDKAKQQFFWIGYMLGCELRNTRPEMEPVAYLYNGVRLPKLPEWDKTKYPYAVMYANQSLNFDYVYSATLFLTDVPLFTEALTSYRYSLMAKTSGNCIVYENILTQGANWVRSYGRDVSFEPGGCLEDGLSAEHLTWSNYDVLDYDAEEVRLAASDPVPVYE